MWFQNFILKMYFDVAFSVSLMNINMVFFIIIVRYIVMHLRIY